MSIFSIGKTRFERLRTNTMVPSFSKRGLHGNQPRKDDTILEQIKSHIQSFPRRTSHYSRNKNAGKVYLHEDLNINRMWRLYLENNEPLQYDILKLGSGQINPCVKYEFYKNIFNTKYNIGFGLPRTDTCLKCDQYNEEIKNATNEETKQKLESERKLHHAKAESCYNLMDLKRKDTNTNPDIDIYSFDFKKTYLLQTCQQVYCSTNAYCGHITLEFMTSGLVTE